MLENIFFLGIKETHPGRKITCFRGNMAGTIDFNLQKKFQYPAGNYMFRVNNKNTRTRHEICLNIKAHSKV